MVQSEGQFWGNSMSMVFIILTVLSCGVMVVALAAIIYVLLTQRDES